MGSEQQVERLPLLIRPEEAAELLGCTKETIVLAINMGELPCIKLGKRTDSWRIPRGAIEELNEYRKLGTDFKDKFEDIDNRIKQLYEKLTELESKKLDENCVFCGNMLGDFALVFYNAKICVECASQLLAGVNRHLQIRRSPLSYQIRGEAIKRHGKKCYYCGKRLTKANMSFDHRLPVSRGGNDDADNIVPCCRSCNSKKGNMTEEEFTASFLQA